MDYLPYPPPPILFHSPNPHGRDFDSAQVSHSLRYLSSCKIRFPGGRHNIYLYLILFSLLGDINRVAFLPGGCCSAVSLIVLFCLLIFYGCAQVLFFLCSQDVAHSCCFRMQVLDITCHLFLILYI